MDKLGHAGTGLKEDLDQQPALAFVPIRHLNQPLLFIARQPLNGTPTDFDVFPSQHSSHLLAHIAGLIIAEVILAPEFSGRGNQRLEVSLRFCDCGWSTHRQASIAYRGIKSLSNCGLYFVLWAFCEIFDGTIIAHGKGKEMHDPLLGVRIRSISDRQNDSLQKRSSLPKQ